MLAGSLEDKIFYLYCLPIWVLSAVACEVKHCLFSLVVCVHFLAISICCVLEQNISLTLFQSTPLNNLCRINAPLIGVFCSRTICSLEKIMLKDFLRAQDNFRYCCGVENFLMDFRV